MRKFKMFFLVLVITFLIPQFLTSQVATYLYKYYNFANEEGRAIVKIGINENLTNWSISGTTNTVTAGKQWFIAKLRPDGTVALFKTLGTPVDDSCFYMTRITRAQKEHILAGFLRDNFLIPHASFIILDSNYNTIIAQILTNDTVGSTFKHITYNSPTNFISTGFMKIRIGALTPFKIIASEFNILSGFLWFKRYHINNYTDVFNEKGFSIAYQPIDNSYIITGVTDRLKTSTLGNTDIFVLKLGAMGNPIWYKIYAFPGLFNSEMNRIIALPDSSYALGGYTNFPDTSRKGDLWLMKISLNGNIIWSKIYGKNTSKEVACSIEYNSFNNSISFGGSYTFQGNEDILGGSVNSLNGSLNGMPSFRANANGNDRIYDMKYDVAGAAANQLVSTGLFGNPVGMISDFSFIRTDVNFRFPGCLSLYLLDTLIAVPVTTDFPVLTEYLQTLPYTVIDSTKNLTIVNECTPVNINKIESYIQTEYYLMQNYPNPFNPITKISYAIPEEGYVKLLIFNSEGKELIRLTDGYQAAGKYSIDFNASDLPSGIYFCSLYSGTFKKAIKLVLIK
jgi:hypothetical protein